MSALFNVLGVITAVASGLMIVVVFRSETYVDQIIPALSIMHSQNLLMMIAVGLGIISALFFSSAAVLGAITRRDA